MTSLAQQRFPRQQREETALATLAERFDPAMNLLGPDPFYPPPSLAYAWMLLVEGSPDSIARAEAILSQVLSSQETRPGHPDYGHFRMRFLDPIIADLNAVQLFLIEIIPITKLFADVVSPTLRDALRASIAAGLDALDEIAAHLTYTNVAVLDIANRILGGELIGDSEAVARGVTKLDDFFAYSNESGGYRDYNSPTYLGQMLSTVATLANHTTDPTTVRKAEIIQERLWLQAATHYHPGLAQFAGPYCRAYPGDVLGSSGQMKSILYAYLDEERLLGPGSGLDRMDGFSNFHIATRDYYTPDYVLRLFSTTPLPSVIKECAERENTLALTSYLGKDHALGTARKGFGSQARNLIVHAASRASETPKVFYSRLLANGDPFDLNTFDVRLPEYGPFAGLQSGRQAIALSGVRLDYRLIDWLGLEFYLLGAESDDAVWSDGRRISPGDRLAAGQWLYLNLGSTYVALFPLLPTPLGDGAEAPITLHQDGTNLRLTVANFDGPARHFWKYAYIPWEHAEPGVAPFYKGNIRAGYVIETADAADCADFETFCREVATTQIADTTEGSNRRVVVERAESRLELAVDLISFESVDRRIDGNDETDPFLDAPNVVQLESDAMTLGGVTVSASKPGPWVVADGDHWRLTNPTPEAVTVTIGGSEVALEPFGSASLGR